MSSNYIKNVAIVGASGRSGGLMTEELLKTGKHTITAVTREGSKSELPEGVRVAKVNYDDPSTLVSALKGQDALVITMATTAPKDQEMKLIHAAGEAGVSWILPNEWGPDSASEDLQKAVSLFKDNAERNERIKELGKSSLLAVSTGFWYEWSLAIEAAYGFDLVNRKVTLFDDGEVKTNMSTWPQLGRAVAALLSLPIHAEDGKQESCLDNFRNKHVYVSSFRVSQREMLESVLRVTGTKEADWTIAKQPAEERYHEGLEAMKKGDWAGFAKYLYSPVFYANGAGDLETSRGLANKVLGLSEENIDEATKVAIERARTNPYA